MKTIGEGDVAALLEVVHDAASASDGDPFPQSVLWALTRLIPSDACVGYQEADVSGAFRVVEQVEIVGEQPSPAVEQAFLTLGWQNPMHCRLHARDRRVLRLSDLLSRRQRRRLEYDSEVWRPHGIDDGLRLWLPAPPGRARCIYLERSGAADYTERERTLLALLRPHLIRIRLDAELRRRRNGNHGLTPREEEVLDWIARGKKNEEIARLLFISTHTVRKHVEHIFEKLDVRTRTKAVAVARPMAPVHPSIAGIAPS